MRNDSIDQPAGYYVGGRERRRRARGVSSAPECGANIPPPILVPAQAARGVEVPLKATSPGSLWEHMKRSLKLGNSWGR